MTEISALPAMSAKVVVAGHPSLRTPCPRVDVKTSSYSELNSFAEILILTMRTYKGVGIAANQIGLPYRIIALEDRAEALATMSNDLFKRQQRIAFESYCLVNPSLEPREEDGTSEWFEGCLSVPDYTAIVPRWNTVVLRAEALDGEAVETTVSGWHARILQHEVDHLNGFLYIDKMKPASFMSKAEYVDKWRSREIREVLAELGVATYQVPVDG